MESRDLIRIQRNDWKWNHFYYFPPSFSSLSFSYFPLILLSARLAFFSLSYLLTILSCFFTFLSATPLLFSLLFILFLSSSSLNYIFVNSLSFSTTLLCFFFLVPKPLSDIIYSDGISEITPFITEHYSTRPCEPFSHLLSPAHSSMHLVCPDVLPPPPMHMSTIWY